MRLLTSSIYLFRIFFSFAAFVFIVSIISNFSFPTNINEKTLREDSNLPLIQRIPALKTNYNNHHQQHVLNLDKTTLANHSYFNTDFLKLNSICEREDAKLCTKPFRKHNSQIYIAPRYKLAACTIPKNMSTMLRALMCYLLDPEKFMKRKQRFSNYQFINICYNGTISNFPSYQNLNENIHEFDPKLWTLLVLVRDPVERFVSVFVDKCVRQKLCMLCKTDFICFIKQAYNDIMEASKNPMNKKVDDAFLMKFYLPQNWDCEMSEFIENYIKLQFTSLRHVKNGFYDELEKFFKSIGVDETEVDYIMKHLYKEKTIHNTQENAILSPISQAITNKIRESSYLSELIVRMYYYDYKLFGFNIPNLKMIYLEERNNKGEEK